MQIDATVIQVWFSALFTIFMYSLVFKETALYRFAAHVFVGSAVGFGLVFAVKAIQTTAWTPLSQGAFVWIVPIVLGIALYLRFVPRYRWVSRYPLAIIVGIGTAITMRTIVDAQFLAQIRATIVINPLGLGKDIVGAPAIPYLNNILLIVSVVSTIIFFVFSGGTNIQKTAAVRYNSKLAIYLMMIAFGAAFGNTVITRVAFMTDRVREVLSPTALPISLPLMLLVVVAMIPRDRLRKLLGKR